MRIVLDLSRHCIQTEIKRQYDQSLSRYFASGPGTAGLEDKIEMLCRAMETLDFGRLRSRYPELAGHTAAAVVLASDPAGRLCVEVNQQPVETGR